MDSPVEILIVVALALLLFGPSRITSLARSLGEAMKEFKIGSDGTPTPTTKAEAPAPTLPPPDGVGTEPVVVGDPLPADEPVVVDDVARGAVDRPDDAGEDADRPIDPRDTP